MPPKNTVLPNNHQRLIPKPPKGIKASPINKKAIEITKPNIDTIPIK